MTFDEARAELDNGRKLVRSSWGEQTARHSYIVMNGNQMQVACSHGATDFVPNDVDIRAADWELRKEES